MLFSSSIVTCQLPFEPRARGAATPADFALLKEERKSSRLSTVLGATLLRLDPIHSALPRGTLTGTDQTSLPLLTRVLAAFGMTLSHPSEFQMLVIGSIRSPRTHV